MAGHVTSKGIPEAQGALDKLAKSIAAGKDKPVFVGTTLFYGRFQERGTRRGVRPRRFLERAASSIRGAAKRLVTDKLEIGDLLAGIIALARQARSQAAAGAPSGRGKLKRSIKVQVGGRLRRG